MIKKLFKKIRNFFTLNREPVKKKPIHYSEEILILARTIYGEARGQSYEGMCAVANVVLNRVATANVKGGFWWGNNITEVCIKPYQFSCWNHNDPNRQIILKARPGNELFQDCLDIAVLAVNGDLADNTNGADHYHTHAVYPKWSKGKEPVKIIGDHKFFKLVN